MTARVQWIDEKARSQAIDATARALAERHGSLPHEERQQAIATLFDYECDDRREEDYPLLHSLLERFRK